MAGATPPARAGEARASGRGPTEAGAASLERPRRAPALPARYHQVVDPLRAHDLEVARTTPPAEKAAQALEAMRLGIELKRASLRARFPAESEEQIDERLRAWLARDD